MSRRSSGSRLPTPTIQPSSSSPGPFRPRSRFRSQKIQTSKSRGRAPAAHVEGSRLAVIGHPKGEALSLLIQGDINNTYGTLVDMGPRNTSPADPVYLHYITSTEPGSSGSPVFETETWQLVGMHHAGFDPVRGRPRLGGKTGSHRANEGISLRSIARAIDRDLPSK